MQKDEAMHPAVPMMEPPPEPELGLHLTLLSLNTGAPPPIPIATSAWLLCMKVIMEWLGWEGTLKII